jgi:hypothetical protein
VGRFVAKYRWHCRNYQLARNRELNHEFETIHLAILSMQLVINTAFIASWSCVKRSAIVDGNAQMRKADVPAITPPSDRSDNFNAKFKHS